MTLESVKSAKNRNRVGQKARVPQPQQKTKTATMMTLACMKLSGTRSLLLFRNELPALLAKTSEGLNRKSTILTTLTSSRFWEKAVLARYRVQRVAVFRFSFSRGWINRVGLWVVVRASRTSRAACLLKINKQVYLSLNLKSLFTGHRKPETVTAVFISGLDAMGKCARNRRNLMRPHLSVIKFRMKMLWFNYF